MSKVRVIDVHTGIFDENNRIADEIRRQNQADQTFLVNIMASPGAGKTSVLLRTIRELKKQYRIGVMEAAFLPSRSTPAANAPWMPP